jgi:uncharacterized protein YbbK (DUF523 family)
VKKVAVSACLLGRRCRYDGGHKRDDELLSELADCEVIPFCPEEAILGAPRETIDLVRGRAIGNESGRDYTQMIRSQAEALAKAHPDLDALYLKAKSPSCALCSARNYDENRNLLSDKESGIFAKELKKWYKIDILKERK